MTFFIFGTHTHEEQHHHITAGALKQTKNHLHATKNTLSLCSNKEKEQAF